MQGLKNRRKQTSFHHILLIGAVILAALCFTGTPVFAEEDYGFRQDLVTGATSSSNLMEPGYDYSPWHIFDEDPSTTWTEGAEGPGYGEYLEVFTEKYAIITGGVIYPGYYKNADLFYKNGAPTRLYLRTGNQEGYLDVDQYAYTWYDNWGGYHFLFDEPLVSDGEVRVTIVGVRDGSKYQDTCISELRFFGYNGTAADVPDLSGTTPHASMSRPAGDQVLYDQIAVPYPGTYSGESQGHDYDMFNNPDGIGGDGRGPDEIDGSSDPEFLDEVTANQLAAFAGTLYRLNCPYGKAENVTVQSRNLYSYSHAYMLNWYQYNIPDSRVRSDGIYHYANEDDLVQMLDELFIYADPQMVWEDLEYFCSQYAVSRGSGVVAMEGTGDFGDAGNFYFDEPLSTQMSGDRILVTGNVLQYNGFTGNYEYVMPYYAYFYQDMAKPSAFRFDELITGSGAGGL